jgi:hypothetical protein
MPSVRDILKGGQTPREPDGEGLDVDQQGLQGAGALDGAPDQADLIAARLRETADQRAAMAQTEINRLQNHIQQLQQRMDELAKMKLPPGNLSADLDDAHQRLEDAEADLDRANEAKQNTELTSSLRQEHHEPSLHVDHTTHQGHGQGGAAGPQKVGAVLGRSGAQPKQGIPGPKRKL